MTTDKEFGSPIGMPPIPKLLDRRLSDPSQMLPPSKGTEVGEEQATQGTFSNKIALGQNGTSSAEDPNLETKQSDTQADEEVQEHEFAKIFPLMRGEEYQQLLESIRHNGLREPILRHPNGTIIDGRNRYRACREAGVEPKFRTFKGDDDLLLELIIDLNATRRHLTESQRAMVAARIANLRRGRPIVNASIDAISQSSAAETLGIGKATLQRAKKVLEDGNEQLARLVDEGKFKVSVAAKVAELDQDEQEAFLAEVARGASSAAALRTVKNQGVERPEETPFDAVGDKAFKDLLCRWQACDSACKDKFMRWLLENEPDILAEYSNPQRP